MAQKRHQISSSSLFSPPPSFVLLLIPAHYIRKLALPAGCRADCWRHSLGGADWCARPSPGSRYQADDGMRHLRRVCSPPEAHRIRRSMPMRQLLNVQDWQLEMSMSIPADPLKPPPPTSLVRAQYFWKLPRLMSIQINDADKSCRIVAEGRRADQLGRWNQFY